MLIKMLGSHRGSEDGFTVKRYMIGETYDVADTMGRAFCRNGWAYNAEPYDDINTTGFGSDVTDDHHPRSNN